MSLNYMENSEKMYGLTYTSLLWRCLNLPMEQKHIECHYLQLML